MFNFISDFLKDLIKDALSYLIDNVSKVLLDNVINPEKSMDGISLDSVFSVIVATGISYCVLKFVIKLLNIYILGIDGDEDAPIQILVINFIKSMAIIYAFNDLYKIFIKIIEELGLKIINTISSLPSDQETILEKLMPDNIGFFSLLVILIGIVMYLILYFKCLKTGVLMLILRMGFPFVASGVMDSNGGIYSTYIQKFLQLSFTIIVQMSMLKLGLLLLLNNNTLWSIVVLTSGAAVENTLKEFILTSGGSIGRGIGSTMMSLANLRRILSK